jgi:hypothetical protein
MRKLVSVALLGGCVAVYSLSAIAQTTMKPTGPSDCKTNQTWDAATKTCKSK